MSEQSSQEPTMEEILASIRRIISEDEQPAEGAPKVAAEESPPEPEPEPVAAAAEEPQAEFQPAPEPPPEIEDEPQDDDDSDLELTQKVETHGDLDFVAAPAEPEPEPAPLAAPATEGQGPGLVSEPVAAAAAAAFGRLSSNILMPAEGRTLEDVVRELLQPLLRQWLDDNLPGIVQQAVEAEVERIARGRVR
jgi:cell pole-organizing protein PopZ